MPCKELTATIRRKRGSWYAVVACPWCRKNHWLLGGAYTVPVETFARFVRLPCGSTVEVRMPTGKSQKTEVRR